MTIRTQSNEITPTVPTFPMQPISSPPPASSDHTSQLHHKVQGDQLGLLSKIRKLPHLANVFSNQPVTLCPPGWRWWRWWENILYSTHPVCLLYLYISMWGPLWEHHICSAQYHSSPPLSVCLLYSSPVSRANVIEFNIMDVHIFSHIFRCIVKSMLRIPKLVIVRPGWWMLHWMWRIAGWGWCEVRWGDTQCGSWCYMTSPQSYHHSNQVFQTLKLTFNNLEGNWLWGGSQVWDHDITDIVIQPEKPTHQVRPTPNKCHGKFPAGAAVIWR